MMMTWTWSDLQITADSNLYPLKIQQGLPIPLILPLLLKMALILLLLPKMVQETDLNKVVKVKEDKEDKDNKIMGQTLEDLDQEV